MLILTGVGILITSNNDLAGQLRHSWNRTIWDRVAILVATGTPTDRKDAEIAPPPASRQRQVRLRPDKIQALLQDYQSGLSVSDTAPKYGISVHTVTKHLTDHGIPIRPNKVQISSADHQQLLELKAQGLNNVQIAKHYGATRQAVQQALQRAARLHPAE